MSRGLTMPDPRNPETYVSEVDEYIARLKDTLLARAVSTLFSHIRASLQVEVTSESDRPFTDIHLTIRLEGQVRGYEGVLYDLGIDEPPELPSPPKPFGTPRLPLGGIAFPRAHPAPFITNRNFPQLSRPGEIDWHIANEAAGVVIKFDPFDLRPSTPQVLPAVPLYVTAPVDDLLELSWAATAGNANGISTGRDQIRIAATSVDLAQVFSESSE
ncbi:MAG: putative DNA-binding protein [Sphaerisporangium sp.]|jgi:hypothetical protein|nr:putative DNA-binding protein [Sphaerisporangium sp.]